MLCLRRLPFLALALAAVFVTGCSLLTDPDESRLGPDAGADTGAVDSGRDSDVDARDTSPPDTGVGPDCEEPTDCPPRLNTSARCVSGSCEYACNAGFDDCDREPLNGCEALTSTVHCGACGAACDPDNASGECTTGTCELTCDIGFADCDGRPENGCEINLSVPSDCGECGNTCAPGELCAGGRCLLTCPPGQTVCDGSCVDLSGDISHCGSCGRTCEARNGTPRCDDRTCGIASCDDGFDDCDRDPSTGCETRLDSPVNCGACGETCALPNATSGCADGSCIVTACAAGFGDCDGLAANGCEADLTTNANCGGCGRVCAIAGGLNASIACVSGMCDVTCDPGFDDCDGSSANGCEAELAVDPNHCGSCGMGCPTPICVDGSCGGPVMCPPARCDVNGDPTDGCEVDLTESVSCSDLEELGNINGDGVGPTLTARGVGQRKFVVNVRETVAPDRPLSLAARLNVPAGVDYELRAWCSGCEVGRTVSSTNGTGVGEEIVVRWRDVSFVDSSRRIVIEVGFFMTPTTSCDPWTLTVVGNAPGSGFSCD